MAFTRVITPLYWEHVRTENLLQAPIHGMTVDDLAARFLERLSKAWHGG